MTEFQQNRDMTLVLRSINLIILFGVRQNKPIPVTARSKTWGLRRLLVGIEGSNPAGGMDVFLF